MLELLLKVFLRKEPKLLRTLDTNCMMQEPKLLRILDTNCMM